MRFYIGHVEVGLLGCNVDLQVDTNISVEHTVSIFSPKDEGSM
jgi:hypothetical protein